MAMRPTAIASPIRMIKPISAETTRWWAVRHSSHNGNPIAFATTDESVAALKPEVPH